MLSQQMIDALSTDTSVIGYAVEIFFVDETTRMHTGVGQILIDGDIYYGTGELGKIGTIESTGDVTPIDLSLELSGVPGDLLSDALQAQVRGRDVVLYVIVFDSNTGQLVIAEPIVNGFVTDYSVIAGGDNRIQLTVSDEFARYDMAWDEYWTDESHRSSENGDRLCRYTSQMESREIQWGSKNDAPPLIYK